MYMYVVESKDNKYLHEKILSVKFYANTTPLHYETSLKDPKSHYDTKNYLRKN